MSLFTTSMLGLVLASSILQVFVFWELVGLCSYLLIGFWFYKDSARRAATKAFMVTRVGDLGFLIAILLIWSEDGHARHRARSTKRRSPVPIELDRHSRGSRSASSPAPPASRRSSRCTSGCRTRWRARRRSPRSSTPPRWSRPVSTWSRASSPCSPSPRTAIATVAAIGAITAIIAALLGIVATDIKRVMAYSTISQLGYMMMALGVGRHRRRHLPPVHARLLQGAALPRLGFREPRDGHVRHAQDGRPPASTCRSRSRPLSIASAWRWWACSRSPASGARTRSWPTPGRTGQWVFWIALAGVFLTALYVGRMLILTFGGEYKGGEALWPRRRAGGRARSIQAARVASRHDCFRSLSWLF